MPLSALLQRVLDWLHAGYPEGVPPQDYFPLLALLARRLTTQDVAEVVSALEVESGSTHRPTSEDVRTAIEQVTNSPALENDVRRIAAELRELGWDTDLNDVADH